jgi:hypothetical protein
MNLIGTCIDETLVEYIFGSISEFARLIEENGDEFNYKGIQISYDTPEDIHYFYY